MTEPIREGQRLPQGDAPQGIDRWARHGVEELTQRDAVERAEMGEPDVGVHRRAADGAAADGEPGRSTGAR